MDTETAQMNGDELNGTTNGDHIEETENGTNGTEEHADNVEQSDIEVLKEKARQSIGDEIELHKTYGEMEESKESETDMMEAAERDIAEGDENAESTNEMSEHKEEGEEQTHIEPDVSDHTELETIDDKESDDIVEQTESDEIAENGEIEDITEQRDSDEPVENEESPGKMMAVSCDSIDVMSTTAEDGSEGGAEEVQSPVSNGSERVEEEEKSGETSENTINGDQSPEVEQVIEEVDNLMEEARDGESSPEEEKDITVEENTEVESEDTTQTEPLEAQTPEPTSDSEVMSPEPVADAEPEIVEEELTAHVEEPKESDVDESHEENEVESVDVPQDSETEAETAQEVSQSQEEVVGEKLKDESQEIQEDETVPEAEQEQEPVVQVEAVEEPGTIDEDQADLAAGSCQEEEMETPAEVQADVVAEEITQEEETPEVEDEQVLQTDHSMEDVVAEEPVSLKEVEAEEEKEQESPRKGEAEVDEIAEIQAEPEEEAPSVEEEVAEHEEQDTEDIESDRELVTESEEIMEEMPQVESVRKDYQTDESDDIEVAQAAHESSQNEQIEIEHEESDIADIPIEDQQDKPEDSCELKESDNVAESQDAVFEAAGTETMHSEDNVHHSESEDQLSDAELHHSTQRRPSAQERFGMSPSISLEDSMSAVLREEDVGDTSSDGASSSGSPRQKRKTRRASDIEGDMEEVENTVRKMSVGSSKEWYKDLFKMTRTEVDKNVCEDTREEEIQSLPSLRNIKSRFENRDEAPQKEVKQPGKIKVDWGTGDMRQKEVSPSPPRDPEIFREEKVQSQEEVLVSYGGLTSIKSRYLESTSTVAAPQGPPAPKVIPRAPEPVQKAPSVSPPREPGVVRSTDNKDETEELPPQNITRGLLARFRDMESQSGNQASPPAPYTKRNVHAKSAPAAPVATSDWERIERSEPSAKRNGTANLRKPSRSDALDGAHSPTRTESPVRDENKNSDEVAEVLHSSPIHVLASRYGTSVRASQKTSSQSAPQKKTSKVWTPPPKVEESASSKIPKHLKRNPIKTCPPPRTDLIEADLQVPERPEAGEFENNPQFRDDVIREDDDNETEHLPASGNLKSRLAVFKQMEATNVNTAGAPSFGNQYSTNRQSPSRMNGNPGNANSGEVLREGEGNPEEELPQVGSAKSMREKFQSMQQNEEAPAASGDRKATAKSKQLLNNTEPHPKGHSFTPPRGSPEKQLAEVTSHVAKKDKNVTREDDPYKGETLPTQEILNSCLNHFRQMEEEAKEQKTREYSPGRKKSRDFSFVTEFHPEQNSAPKKPPRTASSSGPDKTVYNPSAPEGGEFENEPISRDDVVRESDNNEVHELPQEGQARKLREQYLAKAH